MRITDAFSVFGLYFQLELDGINSLVDYRNPTEVIKLRECSTVKSADDDTDRQNAFRARPFLFALLFKIQESSHLSRAQPSRVRVRILLLSVAFLHFRLSLRLLCLALPPRKDV